MVPTREYGCHRTVQPARSADLAPPGWHDGAGGRTLRV